jgi:hypothetical protein
VNSLPPQSQRLKAHFLTLKVTDVSGGVSLTRSDDSDEATRARGRISHSHRKVEALSYAENKTYFTLISFFGNTRFQKRI